MTITKVTQLKIIFLLITGISITLIAQNWFAAWLGIEISTFASIPLLSSAHYSRRSNIASNYILIQSVMSLIIISIMVCLHFETEFLITKFTKPLIAFLVMFNTLMKLGLASFYFGLPQEEHELSLEIKIIITSFQIVPPFIIIYKSMIDDYIIPLILIGVLLIIIAVQEIANNRTEIEIFLIYLSIGYMGWSVIALLFCTWLPIINLASFILFSFVQLAYFDKFIKQKIIYFNIWLCHLIPLTFTIFLAYLTLLYFWP